MVRRIALKVGERCSYTAERRRRLVRHPDRPSVGVLATTGTENQETLKQIDAAVAIDYARNDFVQIALDGTAGAGVNTVFDTVGGGTMVNSIPAARPFARHATILGTQGDLTPLYVNNQTLYGVLLPRKRARLDETTRLLERGQIKPLLEETLDLSEVGKAHERLDSGYGRGKVMLRVAEG